MTLVWCRFRLVERVRSATGDRAGQSVCSLRGNLHNLGKMTLLPVAAMVALCASQSWKNEDPAQWSRQDVAQLLNDSPWAQVAGATFSLIEENKEPPPPGPTPGARTAGLAGSRSDVTDGRWDGGVGRADRNLPPTLNVTVRWDSALPVQQALVRSKSIATKYETKAATDHYIVTVLGLIPAGGNYNSNAQLSSSSDSQDTTRDPRETIEGVMRYSRLLVKKKPAILPDDIKLDQASGELHIFFPRTKAIEPSDKEVVFETRFGLLSVMKRFRLKDMLYHGKLEL